MSSAKAEGDIQKVQNEQWLREEYIKKKRSASNIAEECGLTTGTVERWLDRHGIEQRTLSEEMAHGNVQSLHERDWLHEQYVEKQRSALEIAEECGVSQGTVTDWLENHDIETRHPSVTQADGEVEPLHDEQWLRTQYWGQSKTASEIASELGVYDSTVNRWLDQHGIEKKGQSVSRAGESVQKLMDSDWLQKQYHDQMKSSVEIGRELGVTSRCVLDWMERHGVERRGREGEDNPMWRGGKEDYYGPSWYSARAEARDRDDCSCQRCGMTDAEHESNYDQKLHVHHIEPFRTFDDPAEANQLDNLITLCRQCHNDLEGLPIDLREIQSSP
jgi:5-methylcytosine-specific restriction endonuclease McrA/DNA invertase Pin-like site-specific DNA recombinase